MTVVCLTGWQQPADALAKAAPDAVHFDYGAYDNLGDCYRALADIGEVETAVGWSLGACLLLPAVAHGIIVPKRIVLLAAQYQYLRDESFPDGMPQALAQETREFYFTDPEKMVVHLSQLIARGDSEERTILRRYVPQRPKLWPNGMFWLQQLERFSCESLDLSCLPQTHILHGAQDVIAPPAHAQALHRAIPASELHLWERCGHAPHWHDADAVSRIIAGDGI
jgi:pimeloyl-[acyl-carrier protein] methyl ester esterase